MEVYKNSIDTINALDRVIDNNVLLDDVLLYRNVTPDALKVILDNRINAVSGDDILDAIGTVISDKGFCSTSASNDWNVFVDRGILFEIHAKKGTNAFFTTNSRESEIVLKRGQNFVYKEVRTEKKTYLYIQPPD